MSESSSCTKNAESPEKWWNPHENCVPEWGVAALRGTRKRKIWMGSSHFAEISEEQPRCFWAGNDPLMIDYHDHEWGIPVHDDRTLFEFLILEWAQAGLSWKTILHRREGYRRAFDDFDVEKIIWYDETKIEALMQDSTIIRNRLKIESVRINARAFLAVQKEFGSFDEYVWSFVDGETIVQRPCDRSEYRATSPESDAMSRDLKRRGFKFVGSTICYAFMQAVGMIDEHEVGCFRSL